MTKAIASAPLLPHPSYMATAAEVLAHEPLILCDEQGHEKGFASWEEAHRSPGTLHLAFSIYIFRNNYTEILIQKRSAKKPLWPRFWANTCCSHPRRGYPVEIMAPLRLGEECGFQCPLTMAGSFVYRAEDPQGNGVEHEHVTMLRGEIGNDVSPTPNPDEVAELKWMNVAELQKDMKEHPEIYAPWFHLGLERVLKVL